MGAGALGLGSRSGSGGGSSRSGGRGIGGLGLGSLLGRHGDGWGCLGLKAEDILLKMRLDERATIERCKNAGFGVSKVEVGSWTEKRKTRRWAGCRARGGKIGCLYTEAGSPGATE